MLVPEDKMALSQRCSHFLSHHSAPDIISSGLGVYFKQMLKQFEPFVTLQADVHFYHLQSKALIYSVGCVIFISLVIDNVPAYWSCGLCCMFIHHYE